MAHGVLIPRSIMATNVDSLNRSAICASALDNGNLVVLTTRSATAGEGEVFTAVVPSTSAGLANLWMVYSGDEIVLTDSRYKGIDPDVRNFFTAANKVVSVLNPQVGDILEMTADNFATGTGAASAFANAVDSTGGLKPVWASSNTGSIFSMKYLGTGYISLATGGIDTQRVTSYIMEVVAIA
jgi:hypothetical protein